MKADYSDTYITTVRSTCPMTAKVLFQQIFVHYPKPVLYLLRLRDWLVKPFGLQSGGGFTDLITEQDDSKVIICKSDKHLDFRILLQCDTFNASTHQQTIRISTFVNYHNSLGRIYFFFIRPFHTLLCKQMMNRAARNWEKENIFVNLL